VRHALVASAPVSIAEFRYTQLGQLSKMAVQSLIKLSGSEDHLVRVERRLRDVSDWWTPSLLAAASGRVVPEG
jgi:hypothetical protein